MANHTYTTTKVAVNPRSRYGPRLLSGKPNNHKGTDFLFANGTPVSAWFDGVVTAARYDYEQGYHVDVETEPGFSITYHCLQKGLPVEAGQKIKRGDIIGLAGKTAQGTTGAHLHVGFWINGKHKDLEDYLDLATTGTFNPFPKAFSGVPTTKPTATQRQVGSVPVLRRAAPTSKSADMGAQLEDGSIGNFNGWIKGESVKGNDIWFRGISGHFFWSGGFTDSGTHDLQDLNPKTPVAAPLAAFQRVVRPGSGVRRRTAPNTTAESSEGFEAGTVLDMGGWVTGETVSGNSVWFKGRYSDSYFWSGGFTDSGTHDLPEVKSTIITPPVVAPVTPPVLTPEKPKPSTTPDTLLAKWIGSPNFNKYGTEGTSPIKTHITEHWMDGTLAGTDATFQSGTVASNYGVGLTEIHQYVHEYDYQQADGNKESNTYGVSIEHEGGPSRPVSLSTMELSARLHADIAKRHNLGKLVLGQNVKKHSDFVSTACPGTLDIQYILDRANQINGFVNVVKPPLVEVPSSDPRWGVITTLLVSIGGLITAAVTALQKFN